MVDWVVAPLLEFVFMQRALAGALLSLSACPVASCLHGAGMSR
ncbi:hypothetical protein [Paracoccus mutanolyticus]|nr:hypothetical protein [Paracoccus mutanolyticus]